jgi:2-C-methyl-D-erythritol 4-phosphate cytidylyltransferase
VGAVWGIVVAAGRGDRFGTPKQFCDLRGVRVVDRSVATAAAVCDAVIVVLPEATPWDGPHVDAAVVGGATRSESVRAGLRVVPDDADVIVVHDAARPLASREMFVAVIAAVRDGADAAVPGVAVADTLKRVDGARVVETVARDDLVGVQTPQAFRASVLRAAHARNDDASDDAALVEAVGGRVMVVPGDPVNFKITTPTDLVAAAAALS